MIIESFVYQEQVHFNDDKPAKVVLSETAYTRTTLWCLKPGQKIVPHVHAGDHVWIILEGEGHFLSGSDEYLSVRPGTILSAPAGVSHGIANIGQTGLVFASVSAG